MLERFKNHSAQQHLLPEGREVLLAVSGGRDSVAMADLCHRAGVKFAIAHCNFGLRPGDCDRDEAFVRGLAGRYGAEMHTERYDTRAYAAAHGQGIEEAARELRYAFFARLCRERGYACVATAHHRDDAVETFFLNLFRGTGLEGLRGIPLHSKFNIQNSELHVVRPMLCFSRGEIDAYVAERDLAYVEDHTNSQPVAQRNRIRLQLMPLLRGYGVNAAMVDELINALPTEGGQLFHTSTHSLTLHRGHLIIAPREAARQPRVESAEAALPVRWDRSGREIYVDGDRVRLPLRMRSWESGDRFRPFGMEGSRLVSDFLSGLGLSRLERQWVWVMEDGGGSIVWVVGLRADERTRITDSTKKILQLTLLPTQN